EHLQHCWIGVRRHQQPVFFVCPDPLADEAPEVESSAADGLEEGRRGVDNGGAHLASFLQLLANHTPNWAIQGWPGIVNPSPPISHTRLAPSNKGSAAAKSRSSFGRRPFALNRSWISGAR